MNIDNKNLFKLLEKLLLVFVFIFVVLHKSAVEENENRGYTTESPSFT